MDATVCYYAYSTIAQTLAGAFGFLVAVTLYRVDQLKRERPEQLGRKHMHLSTIATDRTKPAAEASAEMAKIEAVPLEADVDLKRIRRGAMISLYMTAGTIAACFALIVLTPALTLLPWLAWVCLLATGAVAIATLVTFLPLVEDMVR